MSEIFKELKTRNFTFKNRRILAPVATKSASDDGYVTENGKKDAGYYYGMTEAIHREFAGFREEI